MRIFVYFLILIFSTNLVAQEDDSTAFFLTIFPEKISVQSPKRLEKNLNITIENKTLFNLTAKIRNTSKDLIYFTVFSQSKKSVSIKLDTLENLKFVPLTPSIHEVELLAGREIYEIP